MHCSEAEHLAEHEHVKKGLQGLQQIPPWKEMLKALRSNSKKKRNFHSQTLLMQQIDWRQEPGQTTTEGRGKCRPKLGDALTAEKQCTAPWSRSIIAQPLLLACSSEQNILRSQKIIHKETDQKIIYCLEDCRMLLERNNSSSCYNFSTLQD